MSPIHVNFHELCRRHLCKHSQFGLNVWHLVAVAGVYLALFGIVFALPGAPWIVGGALTAYFAVLAMNVPFRLLLLSVAVIGVLLTAFLMLPELLGLPRFPVWGHLILLIVWHRCQVWQHRIYDHSIDASEFADKYKKGPALFVLLAVYELPILLNFLFFGARNLDHSPAPVATNPPVAALPER
jgi:hypothetical protein